MKKMILMIMLAGSLFNNLAAQQVVADTIRIKPTSTQAERIALQGKRIGNGDLIPKEISKEIALPKGGTVYIDNFSRNVIIKTGMQQKVKVSLMMYYEGENKLSDEEWLEKFNLSINETDGAVKIKSVGVTNATQTIAHNNKNDFEGYVIGKADGSSRGVLFGFTGSGQPIGYNSTFKMIVTITIPTGSKLDIKSRYADVTLPSNLDDVYLDIANGNLEAENVSNLVLRSRYSSANLTDIKTAELSVSNGRLSANNIESLDIDTRASNIEIAAVKKLFIISSNDEYEIEEVGEIHGKKDFGSLRITKLNNSIDLNGSSADVRIRNLGAQVSLVKIDDRFANIRIPLNKLKNYAIDFTGSYSSVYGNFEKKALDIIPQPTITSVGKPYITAIGSPNNVNITASANASDTNVTALRLNKITSLGNLTALTVTGFDTEGKAIGYTVKADPIKEVTVTGYGSSSTGSYSEAKASSPSITSMGSISNLTVTGELTAGTINGITTPGSNLGYMSAVNNYQRGATTVAGYPMATANNANFLQFSNNNNTPSRFTAEVGDGKNLKIQIKCPNCTVDLK